MMTYEVVRQEVDDLPLAIARTQQNIIYEVLFAFNKLCDSAVQ